jgi:hypothetical protein
MPVRGSLWCFACLLLPGRSRILARRKDVPSLQTDSNHSIDKDARLREPSRSRGTGTRSLPPRWVRRLPGRRRTMAGKLEIYADKKR